MLRAPVHFLICDAALRGAGGRIGFPTLCHMALEKAVPQDLQK